VSFSRARAFQEFWGKGANVQLGPGVNVARVPRNGRNFEYMSGEDPYLGYTLVQPAVQGIQSQGVIADAKHYVLNNQARESKTISRGTNLQHNVCFACSTLPFNRPTP
jgi:beta-glucosidase